MAADIGRRAGPGAAPAGRSRSRSWSRRRRRDTLVGLLSVLPALILVAALMWYPLATTVYHGFTEWDGVVTDWVGLDNYRQLFGDGDVWQCLRTNLIFFVSIPVILVICLVVAVLLHEQTPGARFFRSVYYLPCMLSVVVVGLLTRSMFAPDGAVNRSLSAVGLGTLATDWLAYTATSFVVLILAFYWQTLGQGALIFLAGLSAMPGSVVEAAQVDGAGWWRRLFRVVLPLQAPATSYFLVTNTAYVFIGLFRSSTPSPAAGREAPPRRWTTRSTSAPSRAASWATPPRSRWCCWRWSRSSPGSRYATSTCTPGRAAGDAGHKRARHPVRHHRGVDGRRRLRGVPAVLHALHQPEEPGRLHPQPVALPAHWTNIDNYIAMFNRFDIGRLYANSVIYVAAAWLICLAVSLPAAFAFAKLEFPGRRLLFVALICSLAIPTVTVIIPDYVLMADLGIIDSPISVVLLWAASQTPSTVFLLAAFMRSLPSEMIDAAAVDGAGYLQTMWRVTLPMSVPAVVTVTIFDVTYWWNDLLTPLVFLQSEDQATITLGVATIVIRYGSNLPLLVSGLVMAALPPILVYVVAQRYIRRGLVLGAVQ